MPSYPDNNAVPGLMWPGFILPGQPVQGEEESQVTDNTVFLSGGL